MREWESDGDTEHRQHSVGMVEWCWNRGAEREQKLTTPNPSLERRGALEEGCRNGIAACGQKSGAGIRERCRNGSVVRE